MTRYLVLTLWLIVASIAGSPALGAADVDLELVDGTMLHGHLLAEDADGIQILRIVITGAGTISDTLRVARGKIARIQPADNDFAEYQQESRSIADTASAHARLARWCRERGLRKPAEDEALRAIAIDATLPEASEELTTLGFALVDGRWLRRADSSTPQRASSVQGSTDAAGAAAIALQRERLHQRVLILRSQDDRFSAALQRLASDRSSLQQRLEADRSIIAKFHDLDQAYQQLLTQQSPSYPSPHSKGVSVEPAGPPGGSTTALALAGDAVEAIRDDARHASAEAPDLESSVYQLQQQELNTTAEQSLVRKHINQALDEIATLSSPSPSAPALGQPATDRGEVQGLGDGYLAIVDDAASAHRAAVSVTTLGLQLLARQAPGPQAMTATPMEMYQRLSAPGGTRASPSTYLPLGFHAPYGWKILLVDQIRGTLRLSSGESLEIQQASSAQAPLSGNPLLPFGSSQLVMTAQPVPPLAPGSPWSATTVPSSDLFFPYPADDHVTYASLKASMRVVLANANDLKAVRIVPATGLEQSVEGIPGNDLLVLLRSDGSVQWTCGGNGLVRVHDVQYRGPHRQLLHPASSNCSSVNDHSTVTLHFSNPVAEIEVHLYDHLQATRNRLFIAQLPVSVADPQRPMTYPTVVSQVVEVPPLLPGPQPALSSPFGNITISTSGRVWNRNSAGTQQLEKPPTSDPSLGFPP
jgi:hypothetical protein